MRWHEFLSGFNLEVVYVKGSEQKVADPLSRAPWTYPGYTEDPDYSFHGTITSQNLANRLDYLENVLDALLDSSTSVAPTPIAPITTRATREEQRFNVFRDAWEYSEDETYGPIFDDLSAGNEVERFSLSTTSRLLEHTLLGTRQCVPAHLVSEVLQTYHAMGHPSEQKLLFLVLRRYTFSKQQSELKRICSDIVRTCQVCQAVKPRVGRQPNTLDFFPIPEEMFTSLCMDFVYFLLKGVEASV